jgi:hypothetical protein
MKILKLLIMQFSSASFTLLNLGRNISSYILFSNSLDVGSSFRARDKFPHPNKTADKIIIPP